MVELIDKKSNKKLMALVICGIKYKDLSYLVYSVRREKEDANIFISRLVVNSEGYTISDSFDNGEKDVIDNVVKMLINMTSVSELEEKGFVIIHDIKLTDVNYFSVKDCYVSTAPRDLIRRVMEYYGLLDNAVVNSPIVEVEEENKLNPGFASNIVLIVFGLFIVVFCIVVVVGVLRG